MNYILGIVFIACGLFSFFGAYKSWGFFVNSSKFKSWAKLIGEKGARIFYMALGVFIILMAFVLMFGVQLGIIQE